MQLRVAGQTKFRTVQGACMTIVLALVAAWFLIHMLLTVAQRSDQLRMHHKTLQEGDTHGYQQNMTFYAGSVANEPPLQYADGAARESEPPS